MIPPALPSPTLITRPPPPPACRGVRAVKGGDEGGPGGGADVGEGDDGPGAVRDGLDDVGVLRAPRPRWPAAATASDAPPPPCDPPHGGGGRWRGVSRTAHPPSNRPRNNSFGTAAPKENIDVKICDNQAESEQTHYSDGCLSWKKPTPSTAQRARGHLAQQSEFHGAG